MVLLLVTLPGEEQADSLPPLSGGVFQQFQNLMADMLPANIVAMFDAVN